MGSNVQDVTLVSESINGVPLPLGSEDVETVFTPPPGFLEATQAGNAAVIAKSRQSFGAVVFTAAQGSQRYHDLMRFVQRAKAPGFVGEQYTAVWPARGRTVSGRLFPGETGDFTVSETSQESTFTMRLLDVADITAPAAGLAS